MKFTLSLLRHSAALEASAKINLRTDLRRWDVQTYNFSYSTATFDRNKSRSKTSNSNRVQDCLYRVLDGRVDTLRSVVSPSRNHGYVLSDIAPFQPTPK